MVYYYYLLLSANISKLFCLLIHEVAAPSWHFDIIAPFVNVRTYLLTYSSCVCLYGRRLICWWTSSCRTTAWNTCSKWWVTIPSISSVLCESTSIWCTATVHCRSAIDIISPSWWLCAWLIYLGDSRAVFWFYVSQSISQWISQSDQNF